MASGGAAGGAAGRGNMAGAAACTPMLAAGAGTLGMAMSSKPTRTSRSRGCQRQAAQRAPQLSAPRRLART